MANEEVRADLLGNFLQCFLTPIKGHEEEAIHLFLFFFFMLHSCMQYLGPREPHVTKKDTGQRQRQHAKHRNM